jgi:probable F420-dependent oxidoreductase
VKFTLEYPLSGTSSGGDFADGPSVSRVAAVAEAAGFDAIGFTEHPAPSRKWLASGGHAAFDPFAALAYCAAVTERMRLMTYLAVLPYRNPFLTAKAAVTVDCLSGGRLILTAGSGYLKSEFLALGVDFDERNELTDETIEVIKGVWSAETFSFQGRHFSAREQAATPRPAQATAPLWFGGNSRKARRRVALHGQGWATLAANATFAATTRTAVLDNLADLKSGIDDLHEVATEAGRDPATIDVQVDESAGTATPSSIEAGRVLARITQLAGVGVTWMLVRPNAASLAASLEWIEAYGKDVIASAR